MDIARDLLDHQLVDRDGLFCGRVDDVMLQWADRRPCLGALLTGGGFLVDALGAVGQVAAALLRPVPSPRPLARRLIGWGDIDRVEQRLVHLRLSSAELLERDNGAEIDAEESLSWRRLSGVSIRDAEGSLVHLIDVQAELPSPPAKPVVLGLLVAPGRRGGRLSLKRHDLMVVRIPGSNGVRWAAASAVMFGEGSTIGLSSRFSDLGHPTSEQDPGPPPQEDDEG